VNHVLQSASDKIFYGHERLNRGSTSTLPDMRLEDRTGESIGTAAALGEIGSNFVPSCRVASTKLVPSDQEQYKRCITEIRKI
jgi:hypothetical protein